MKSILLAGAFMALAAAASAQGAKSPVEQALSGTWTCATEEQGTSVTSTTTYLAGGKETYDVVVNAGGGQLEFTGTGTADWKLMPDGKLTETITALTVKTAKLAGQDAPIATVQPMVEPMIVNQTSTSAIALKDGGMILTGDDGTVTTCKR
jgi:hypothetical protein